MNLNCLKNSKNNVLKILINISKKNKERIRMKGYYHLLVALPLLLPGFL
jgi:hypothetical protein